MQYWLITSPSVQLQGGAAQFMPQGALPLTTEQAASVQAAMMAGKSISVSGGQLVIADPPAPDPAEALAEWRATAKVSRFQAFAALDAAGLLGQATALVTAQGGVAKLAWDNAIEFRRSSPTINGLASAMGLTDEALDALFLAAAEIEA